MENGYREVIIKKFFELPCFATQLLRKTLCEDVKLMENVNTKALFII
jgi:hypothetical protein